VAQDQTPTVPSPRRRVLIGNTVGVILGNAVPAYGVVFWGWPPFNLIALFILEGLIVLAGDYVKAGFRKSVALVERNFRNNSRQLLFFETVFILFFGGFAVMVFGPGEEFGAGFAALKELATSDLRLPLLYLLALRSVRLAGDIRAAGAFGRAPRAPLTLGGGGWMLLLFFAVMTAPLLAKAGPNPRGGLFALVALKTAGELLGFWAGVIDRKLARTSKRR